jgi:hypothetical protein
LRVSTGFAPVSPTKIKLALCEHALTLAAKSKELFAHAKASKYDFCACKNNK